MRIIADITAPRDAELAWDDIHKPGQRIVYEALRAHDPELGAALHEHGWGTYGLVPFGFQPPVFPAGKRQPKRYPTGGPGTIGFATPLPRVAAALARTIQAGQVLGWGGLDITVAAVRADDASYGAGKAIWRTTTPVIVKGRGKPRPGKSSQPNFLLPQDPEWGTYLVSNLERKAATFELPDDIDVKVLDHGPRRLFRVGKNARIGVTATVEVHAAPDTLRLIHDWGLGQGNSAGFGWVENVS